MLLLAFTAQRARAHHPEMVRLMLQGDMLSALRIGQQSLARADAQDQPLLQAMGGQLIGRCLLALGREDEADETFRRLARCYQSLSRPHVRWLGGQDRGVLMLHLNRPHRAADAFYQVASDPQAEPVLRAEAMLGAAIALHRAGDCPGAWRSHQAARALLAAQADSTLCLLAEAIGLELCVLQHSRTTDALDDHAMREVYCQGADELPDAVALQHRLAEAIRGLEAAAPMAARRLSHLAGFRQHLMSSVLAAAHVQDGLKWLQAHRLASYEQAVRVESALMLIAQGALDAAARLLAEQVSDERQVRRNRHALDLHYCQSRLSLAQGRATDALRWYKLHSHETVLALRHQAARLPSHSFLGVQEPSDAGAGDTTRSRLPLRYRRGYQFIIDNLHDENLCVGTVASHLGVTERALQMAFRTHLGMSPAELIRTRRMERIREDICAGAGQHDLMDLASQWGIKSRSTLASNYRSRFAETPSQTLQGKATR